MLGAYSVLWGPYSKYAAIHRHFRLFVDLLAARMCTLRAACFARPEFICCVLLLRECKLHVWQASGDGGAAGHGHVQQHSVREGAVRGPEPPGAPGGGGGQVPPRDLLHHWQLLLPEGPAREGEPSTPAPLASGHPHRSCPEQGAQHGCALASAAFSLAISHPAGCAVPARAVWSVIVTWMHGAGCRLPRRDMQVAPVDRAFVSLRPGKELPRTIMLCPWAGSLVLSARAEAQPPLPVGLDADGSRVRRDEEPARCHRCPAAHLQRAVPLLSACISTLACWAHAHAAARHATPATAGACHSVGHVIVFLTDWAALPNRVPAQTAMRHWAWE